MRKVFNTIIEVRDMIDSLDNSKKYIVDIQELENDTGFEVNWQEEKMYTSLDGLVYPDEFWITEAGDMLQIQDITPEHCRNILRMLIRNNRSIAESIEDFQSQIADVLLAISADDPGDGVGFGILPHDAKPTLH